MSSLFGLDQSSRLVFVSEVPRGLACQCRCVVCDEPLIARQGAVREHHFAHASGREPCDAGHESVLHLYAKQVIQDAGGLVVPMDEQVGAILGMPQTQSPVVRLPLPRVEVEKALADVRPDLGLASWKTLYVPASQPAISDEIAPAAHPFRDGLSILIYAEEGGAACTADSTCIAAANQPAAA